VTKILTKTVTKILTKPISFGLAKVDILLINRIGLTPGAER